MTATAGRSVKNAFTSWSNDKVSHGGDANAPLKPELSTAEPVNSSAIPPLAAPTCYELGFKYAK